MCYWQFPSTDMQYGVKDDAGVEIVVSWLSTPIKCGCEVTLGRELSALKMVSTENDADQIITDCHLHSAPYFEDFL